MPRNSKPARDAWEHLRLTDRIRPGVRVLFVGINPGVRSAVTGHHFAGYSNRFWKLLHESRLVLRPVTCEDDVCLPDWGYGMTNLVPRPSPGIDDLKPAEYAAARAMLVRKIRRYAPHVVALVGVTLHRALFPERRKEPITLGWQDERLGGTRVFVLPNPSGRNANFSYAEMLTAFKALRRAIARQR
jgi:TDG/mug DNA glycosylase family protein